MEVNNEKKKSAQKPDKNLELMIENDHWAASPASPLSSYEENKGTNSANS